MFNDVSERKAAELARRQFQEGVITRRPATPVRLNAAADVKLQNLLSSVVENAQLAALEITDGTQPAAIPALLASVRDSVLRTASVLSHLLWHIGSRTPDPK